jgi:pilus assembly protein CpaB
MSARQIIVLGFALVCAVAALFLVRGMNARTDATAEVVAISGPRVLVAARDVPAGSPLQPTDLEWRLWAEEGLSPQFLTQKDAPEAQNEHVGAVTRQDLLAGEPIVASRIVKPGEQGFMAALVRPGYRAVAVPVSQETAASGFILPGDKVDVILTRKLTVIMSGGSQAEEVRSGIVLQDVRVLAIDQTYKRTDGEDGPEAVTGSVALLELSARDSELLAMADEMGDLSLALRPVLNANRTDTGSQRVGTDMLEQTGQAARDEVRIHSAGTVTSIDAPSMGSSR